MSKHLAFKVKDGIAVIQISTHRFRLIQYFQARQNSISCGSTGIAVTGMSSAHFVDDGRPLTLREAHWEYV